jgi:integral membrane protein
MSLKNVRRIAIAEGVSYLAFAVTMPLKYGMDILWPNKIIGMTHGLLFILYVLAMFWAWRTFKWRWETLAIGLLASLIPFAPFYFDKRYLRATSSESQM